MGMPRYAAKNDHNHVEIVRALEARGLKVWSTNKVGGGFPDMIAANERVTILVEVKNVKGLNKLSKAQKEFIESWPGRVEIVRNIEDVENIKI